MSAQDMTFWNESLGDVLPTVSKFWEKRLNSVNVYHVKL